MGQADADQQSDISTKTADSLYEVGLLIYEATNYEIR